MKQIKVLAFDTGGTVLDWHAGLTAAMAAWGTAHGIERDWHALANEHRRRSLRRMTGAVDPDFNIDDVHRDVLVAANRARAEVEAAPEENFRPGNARPR